MSEHRDAQIIMRRAFTHAVCQLVHATFFTFGNHHHRSDFAQLRSAVQSSKHFVQVQMLLWNQNILYTTRNSAVEREKTSIAPHHFDEKQTIVRGRGVTNFINRFNHGIERGVITNRGVRAVNIVINRPWQTNNRYIVFGTKNFRPSERTITTDDHQSVQFIFFIMLVSNRAPFGGHEFHATRSAQHRSTFLNDAFHIARSQLFHLIFNQAFITLLNPDGNQTVISTCTHHGTQRGIHPRGIATRS